MTSKDTRQNILNVSKKLFAKHGFKGTSTQMIADAVGIKKPSIYYFFKNKEAIYIELLSETVELMINIFEDTNTPLKKTLEQFFATAKSSGAYLYSLSTLSKKHTEYFGKRGEVLKKNIHSVLSPYELRCSTREATTIILDTVSSYGRKHAQGEKVVSPKKYAQLITTLLLK